MYCISNWYWASRTPRISSFFALASSRPDISDRISTVCFRSSELDVGWLSLITLARDSYSDKQFFRSTDACASTLLSRTCCFRTSISRSRSASAIWFRFVCRTRLCCHRISFVSSRSKSSTSRTRSFLESSMTSASGVADDNSARKVPNFCAHRVSELLWPPLLPLLLVSSRYCSVSVVINGMLSLETIVLDRRFLSSPLATTMNSIVL
mmetsp:Transcript_12546/g.26552  ORF Transcript_12546/g.26552 Transcript_12546/m.26552 type:complete len:209 (-) Transcript_12546:86-712(-)